MGWILIDTYRLHYGILSFIILRSQDVKLNLDIADPYQGVYKVL